jgi:selenide,water dikinase
MMTNAGAKPGDRIYLSKSLGTGIVTTAAKFDDCPESVLKAAIAYMSTLNKEACEKAVASGSKCATDITGFGLAGHCFNVARASNVAIQINASALPLIGGVIDLIEKRHVTAGAQKNREFMASALVFENIPTVLEHVVLDPQTSGGLAIFSKEPIEGYPEIGVVVDDEPSVNVIS